MDQTKNGFKILLFLDFSFPYIDYLVNDEKDNSSFFEESKLFSIESSTIFKELKPITAITPAQKKMLQEFQENDHEIVLNSFV